MFPRHPLKPRLGFRAISFLFSFLCALSFWLPACRPTPTPPTRVHLRIGSSDSTQYIAREIADAYRRARPLTTFDFVTTNSTITLREMARGTLDFALVARTPRADELERAGAEALQLGRDGVYLVVHPSNPLQELSSQDLAKILSGEIFRWSALGIQLPDGRDTIQVLSREEGAGPRQLLEEKILLGRRMTPTALLRPTNLDMLDYVASHPHAIGYVAANIWDANSGTRPLALDGVAATRANIAKGAYPLIQTVFLIVSRAPRAEVVDFLNFLAATEGRQTLYRRIAELPSP